MPEPVAPQVIAATPGASPSAIRLLPWLATAAVVAVAVGLLRWQGRLWWCACGRPLPWAGDVWGRHNSQHPFDPYSFTHVLHGVVLCGLVAWAFPRLAPAWRLCLAVSAEAAWEVFENSEFVIERYRAATAALDYRGDTVANVLGDVLSCGVGFVLARRLGPWRSLALFLVTEAVLLFWIRDGVLLNILMLAYPSEAIRAWQTGH